MDLMEKQVALEMTMMGAGRDHLMGKIRKAREKGKEEGTPYGSRIVAAGIQKVADGVTSWLTSTATGKAGRRHAAAKYLRQADPKVAALIALRGVVAGLARGVSLTNLASRIGSGMEAEAKFTHFLQNDPKAFKFAKKWAEEYSPVPWKKSKLMSAGMKKAGVTWAAWPRNDSLHVGIRLVEIIRDTTGMIEIVREREGKRDRYVVRPTAATEAWIEAHCNHAGVMFPHWAPCVVPPVAWTSPTEGGYHTDILPQLPLIKTRNKAYLEELHNRVDDMPTVYQAVNAVQDTAWRVNRFVLQVFEDVWGMGGGVAGIPDANPIDLPPIPGHIKLDMDRTAWPEDWKADWKAWKKAASKVHVANNSAVSKRIAIMTVLKVAREYAQEEAIYFPHTLDFRGRLYAVPRVLNPQGADYSKALLEFSEGIPLGDQKAADWLAIHGANTWGYDKVSLADRVAWVREHESRILSVAHNPVDDLWWTEADKPWQFLAFCNEWRGYCEQGLDFPSRLPVAMDGSCNGLQIFSLILRDAKGGMEVNILPRETPADIYQTVADKVIAKLRDIEAEGGTEDAVLARQWLAFGINRKATKRQVMVLPYGGTFRSCMAYTIEYIASKEQEMREQMGTDFDRAAATPWPDGFFEAGNWLAKYIWEAIGETVKSARECMDWLRHTAKLAAAEGLPVTWITPAGLPVLQEYRDTEARRVKTVLGDSVVRLNLREEIDRLDRRRQANGISPNFVHSLDAAALMLSVQKASEAGINAFAMIHDSYGTHAAKSETLARCLREAFVQMFTEQDVLAEFKASVEALLPPEKRGDIRSLPAKGDLDVTAVLESPFFFA